MTENTIKENKNDGAGTSLVHKNTSKVSKWPKCDVPRYSQKPQPLDGGWGWAVVFGSALGHFLLVGLARTLGVFFVDWVDRFGGSAAETVLVQSIFNTVRMVTGPFVAMLCDAIGCRPVVMTGGFVFSIGCLISSFATNLTFLYLSFSLVGGLGAGCIFTPMFIMVNHYFENKKGIAMALATMGSGLGTLVLAPLWTLLLQEFGHYGSMLILSGIMMNTMVVGALYRPLESKLNFRSPRPSIIELKVIAGSDESDDNCLETPKDNVHGPSQSKAEQLNENSNEEDALVISNDLTVKKESLSSKQSLSNDKDPKGNTVKPTSSQSSKSCANDITNQRESKCASFKNKFAVLKSLTFWFYSFYMAALPCAVQVYVIYLPSILKERGFSKTQSALVLSISGGADIAGRFIAGFLFDLDIIRKRRWPTHCMYGISLGIVVLVHGVQYHLVGFIAMALLWGLFEGGYHSQRATIVSEFITREQIASSVGLMIFWQGIGNMVSPTFAGYLKDVFGTFSVCFYYGGAGMTLCAVMFFVNFLIVHFNRKRSNASLTNQNSKTMLPKV